MPPKDEGLQWLSITDFSAGCYSSGGTVVGNTVNRLLEAPLGAADAQNTWSCYALPDKSLAALPGITATYTWPDTSNPSGYDHGASRPTYMVGCLIHDELANGEHRGHPHGGVRRWLQPLLAGVFLRLVTAGTTQSGLDGQHLGCGDLRLSLSAVHPGRQRLRHQHG